MEINLYKDILQGYTNESMAEGRMVLLTVPEKDAPGLFGVALPTSAGEAALAKYVVAWPPTQQKPPYMTPMPAVAWSLRKGFDKTANDPESVTLSEVYAGDRKDSTIPEATLVRVFGGANSTFTVTSGNFVYSASLTKGAPLSVAYSGDDKGKLQYDANGTVAIVDEFDSDTFELTFRLL